MTPDGSPARAGHYIPDTGAALAGVFNPLDGDNQAETVALVDRLLVARGATDVRDYFFGQPGRKPRSDTRVGGHHPKRKEPA